MPICYQRIAVRRLSHPSHNRAIHMDIIAGLIRLRLGIAFLMILGVFGFATWRELEYGLWGQIAQGTVTDLRLETTCRTRRMPAQHYYSIEYQFTDPSGTLRRDKDTVSLNYPKPAIGDTINIQYCPSPIAISRLQGNDKFILVFAFFIMLSVGCAIFFLVRLWKGIMAKEMSTVAFPIDYGTPRRRHMP